MSDYVELISTFNQADIAIVKSILDDGEIDYYWKGENFSFIDPLIQPAILLVRKDEVELATNLLKDLKLRYNGVSLRSDDVEDEEEEEK